jgi:hypothetical protein
MDDTDARDTLSGEHNADGLCGFGFCNGPSDRRPTRRGDLALGLTEQVASKPRLELSIFVHEVRGSAAACSACRVKQMLNV